MARPLPDESFDEYALRWFQTREAIAARRDQLCRQLRKGVEKALRDLDDLTTAPHL